MAKSVKSRKRKVYTITKSKKRSLNNSLKKKTAKAVPLPEFHVKTDFDRTRPMIANYKLMGLSMNPNNAVSQPETIASRIYKELNYDESKAPTGKQIILPRKGFNTIDKIEESARLQVEAKKKLSESKVGSCPNGSDDNLLIKYLLDKYDKEDYKGMARDPRNYYQLTPRRIRIMIRSFCEDPLIFIPYCKEKGLLPNKPTAVSEPEIMNVDSSVES
jgi:DNA-binding PadR family transcriptional regulator